MPCERMPCCRRPANCPLTIVNAVYSCLLCCLVKLASKLTCFVCCRCCSFMSLFCFIFYLRRLPLAVSKSERVQVLVSSGRQLLLLLVLLLPSSFTSFYTLDICNEKEILPFGVGCLLRVVYINISRCLKLHM